MFGIEDFSKPIVDFSNFEFSQLGEALVFGGAILLIGMATIFSVLCLLWLFLAIFKAVFQNVGNKKVSKKKASSAVETVEQASDAGTSDEGELVAVITAAIAMAEKENSDMKFRVVSFKRV